MRTLNRLLLAVAFAMGASAQSGADTLKAGSGLGLSIGALPPIVFSLAADQEITVSSGGGFTEPAGIFTGSIALPTALFTGVALINGLTIGNLANGQKVIANGAAPGTRTTDVLRPGGGLGGPGPLGGTAFVNVLGLFNLAVPLGVVGNPGQTTAVVAGSLFVTVNGTGWTTGQITIKGITTANPVTTPNAPENINTVTPVGYDNRTPNHGGVVQLISAFKVITNAAGNLPGLATQTLTFVPEPGTALLLGAGVATLGLCGWLRARRK